MTEKKYVSVGKISKPHGIHGALIFMLDNDLKDTTSFPDHFFIQSNGIYEPLFVQSFNCTDSSSGQIVFEGVSGRSGAERLINKELFLTQAHEQQYFAAEDDEDNFIGYKVLVDGKEIGVITDIEVMPMQELFVVDVFGKEVLIPFVDDFIEDINDEAQTISFILPEGLLDI